jgi:hypothetical protein
MLIAMDLEGRPGAKLCPRDLSEVIVLTRRMLIAVCALCLAIPAAASASGADPPTAKGPYGITTTTGPQDIVKAKGPYGPTTTTGPQKTTATAHAAGASGRDSMDNWRTAAIFETALLGALALGSAVLLAARHRAPRVGA